MNIVGKHAVLTIVLLKKNY